MVEHRTGHGFDAGRRDSTLAAKWAKLQINVSWMFSNRGTFLKNKQ